jgi:2,4-didehydro-3-deoxy-L-rhamnonate hydrolase
MGVVTGDVITPLCPREAFYEDVDGWLRRARDLERPGVPVESVSPLPPVPATAKVLCLGLNYRAHAAEAGDMPPGSPNIFARWASTLVPPGTPVAVPVGEPGLDWEGELAVIVGRRLVAATVDQAREAILGYSCFNDISARTFQMAASQWALGKNADRSAPLGPTIVPADEVADADALTLETRVNGEVVQSAKTEQMIFKPDETLAYASGCLTLEPGDVLATGTPDGVGFLRSPPRLMGPGDVVEIEIETLGVLRNPIVAPD